MKLEKEAFKLVKKLNKAESEAARLTNELIEIVGDIFDGCYIEGFFITDNPQGEEQCEGEWCDQVTGLESDTGSGTYYFPVEGTRKYIGVKYAF